MDYPDTQDLSSYIPGYEDYLERENKQITEEEIDDMYEEYLIRKLEEEESKENETN